MYYYVRASVRTIMSMPIHHFAKTPSLHIFVDISLLITNCTLRQMNRPGRMKPRQQPDRGKHWRMRQCDILMRTRGNDIAVALVAEGAQ